MNNYNKNKVNKLVLMPYVDRKLGLLLSVVKSNIEINYVAHNYNEKFLANVYLGGPKMNKHNLKAIYTKK